MILDGEATLRKALIAGLGAVVLAAPLFSENPFYIHLAILICINLVVVNGLSMLSRAGQLSFCHAAFMGLGAYTSALCTMQLGLPFLLSAALGTVFSAFCAYLLGLVIVRLRGVYFVLITFAFGELFRLMLLEGSALTGGANGIAAIPAINIFGVVFDDKRSFYLLALAVGILSIVFMVHFFKTPKGHSLDAVGENQELAEATGISVQGSQLFAFTVGSAMASLGGALYASYVGFISPESFGLQTSILLVVMLVVGGRYSVYGPLVGVFVMTLLPEFFRSAVQMQNIFYGVTLILVLRFLPQGLAGVSSLLKMRSSKESRA